VDHSYNRHVNITTQYGAVGNRRVSFNATSAAALAQGHRHSDLCYQCCQAQYKRTNSALPPPPLTTPHTLWRTTFTHMHTHAHTQIPYQSCPLWHLWPIATLPTRTQVCTHTHAHTQIPYQSCPLWHLWPTATLPTRQCFFFRF